MKPVRVEPSAKLTWFVIKSKSVMTSRCVLHIYVIDANSSDLTKTSVGRTVLVEALSLSGTFYGNPLKLLKYLSLIYPMSVHIATEIFSQEGGNR